MSTEERLTQLENAFVTLTRLVESMDSRLNTQLGWINSLGESQVRLEETQVNSEAKIAALADAQIRTEEARIRLEVAQANSESKIAALADAQIRAEEAQANAQVRLEAAQANSEAKIVALADAQIRTEEALTRLAEAQAHTDQRLDALLDVVRELRNGKP